MKIKLKINSKKYKNIKFNVGGDFVSTQAITLISLVITKLVPTA